jgi:Uncharacterised protein family (UPF0014)
MSSDCLATCSVMGIIVIPGMMSGSILGGSSVHQAAKLQIIVMFMITASVVLASVFITFAAIVMVVDQDHLIRSDRIDRKMPAIYWVKEWNVRELSTSVSKSFYWTKSRGRRLDLEETRELLLR